MGGVHARPHALRQQEAFLDAVDGQIAFGASVQCVMFNPATTLGRLFLRNIAMSFDAYLHAPKQEAPRYSMTA
jgi:hypothetical protein